LATKQASAMDVFVVLILSGKGLRMFKTLLTALRLIWLAATDKDLKCRLILSYIFGIVQGVIAFFSPFALSEMIKQISQKNTDGTLFYFYVMIALAAGMVISRFTWRYVCEQISRILPIKLRQIYYGKIFNKSYDWHLQNSVGYFSTALTNVCKMLEGWLWKLPYDYVGSLVMAVCFLIYTWSLSFYLFLYFSISLTLMLWITRILYNRRFKYIENYSKNFVAYGKAFIDFLYNVRSVKKMNLLSFVNKKLDERGAKVFTSGIKLMRYNSFQYGFTETFINVLFLVPIGYYVFLFLKTGSGVEIIVMIAAIQSKIAELGRQMMGMMSELARTGADYKILAEHLGNDAPKTAAHRSIRKWHEIKFTDTFFEYVKVGSIFTHRVSDFCIHRGDHIAVTGKSGEGKTTFLNLLTNQFHVMDGKISVDGVDYKDLPAAFFDDHMTYISQDVELFDMSLYDNIVMGKHISDKKLQKVLDGCCLNELIARMNGNLHTDIGEKGVKVSAGEKQRISLARGLLLDRDILVLDEITANLDPMTTQSIWHFIFTAYADKTIIAVSHEKDLLNHVSRRLEFKKGSAQVKGQK